MPSRGRYDRARSVSARTHDARTRLIDAVIQVWDFGEELTVSTICARAGTGRNTFYAHFADVAHAERAARAHAIEELRSELDADPEPPTPLERIRAAVASWVRALSLDPTRARYSLRTAEDGTSVAGELLRARLTRLVCAAARQGALPADDDATRVMVALGALEALCRFAAKAPVQLPELERRAADLVLRNLR